MKIILWGMVAATTLVAPVSGLATPPVHTLRIVARNRPSCGDHLLSVGFRQPVQIVVRRRTREITVKVVRKTDTDDQMIVKLNYQPGSGMGFDEVDISSVCHIHTDGTIEIFPGGTSLVDVTVKFDQPDEYMWPPGGPYYAIQSKKGVPPSGQCPLKPTIWAWPGYPPTIDTINNWLLFKMPVKSSQEAYYQLNYATEGEPFSHCVDPEIINH
jgi:hypothetical protein